MEANIDILVKELCKLPKETGWVGFKHNNCEPMMVGEDICALANTATLKDRNFAYMVWGVEDNTHNIIGTTVRLPMQKKGQQELEYRNISPEDKIWSCYLHACLLYIQGDALTNASLRDRFGLKDSSAGSISRLIKDAVDKKLIKPLDPQTAKRYMRYVPIWASV